MLPCHLLPGKPSLHHLRVSFRKPCGGPADPSLARIQPPPKAHIPTQNFTAPLPQMIAPVFLIFSRKDAPRFTVNNQRQDCWEQEKSRGAPVALSSLVPPAQLSESNWPGSA